MQYAILWRSIVEHIADQGEKQQGKQYSIQHIAEGDTMWELSVGQESIQAFGICYNFQWFPRFWARNGSNFGPTK